MKGISPMVATVLLLAFTVAVGGIISVWLTGMTRTQTASVTTSAQCASTRLDVSAAITSTSSVNSFVQVTYTNLGPEVVYPMNVTLSCGAVTNTTFAAEIGSALQVGFSNQKAMFLNGSICGTGNITAKVSSKCGSDQKASVYGECVGTNC